MEESGAPNFQKGGRDADVMTLKASPGSLQTPVIFSGGRGWREGSSGVLQEVPHELNQSAIV